MDKTREIFKDYIKNELKLSQSTVDGYLRDVSQFCDFLLQNGIYRVNKYKASDLSFYIEYLKIQGTSHSSIQRKISSLRKFFNFLFDNHLIGKESMRGFDVPKPEKNKPDALSPREIAALLAAPDIKTDKGIRDRAMLELICATGIKATELICLDVSDVLLDSSAICCGMNGSRRTIVFGASSKKYIKKYALKTRYELMTSKKEKAFFLNMTGERLTRQGFCKILRGYSEEIGCKDRITPNSLRFSFAQKLMQTGVKVDSIQDILGHADKSTTQAYLQTCKPKLLLELD